MAWAYMHDELLVMIFLERFKQGLDPTGHFTYSYVRVTEVCRSWKRVALSCSKLWAHIQIGIPKEGHAILLSRAGGAKLHIYASSGGDGYLRRCFEYGRSRPTPQLLPVAHHLHLSVSPHRDLIEEPYWIGVFHSHELRRDDDYPPLCEHIKELSFHVECPDTRHPLPFRPPCIHPTLPDTRHPLPFRPPCIHPTLPYPLRWQDNETLVQTFTFAGVLTGQALFIAPMVKKLTYHFWPLRAESYPSSVLDIASRWGAAKHVETIELISLKMAFLDTATANDAEELRKVEMPSVKSVKAWDCDKDCVELLLRVVRFPSLKTVEWDGEVEKMDGGRTGYCPLIERCAWNE
ncbi:hypothetical protein SISSUDRAFT_1037707 [Sistotremastrum suecicum HHB10207 ss-3]|uniref:Uncharacterized protein n=1 Tax=Sistotremastrum suecicum HHB10207 ss-3 TaxID=1314776 RepID=A0A165XS67_9AGAM|nr:hypothetical protein SISSUDRAFT_1037707 [Sistotremastrum suecicum HHB10207 ss-3]